MSLRIYKHMGGVGSMSLLKISQERQHGLGRWLRGWSVCRDDEWPRARGPQMHMKMDVVRCALTVRWEVEAGGSPAAHRLASLEHSQPRWQRREAGGEVVRWPSYMHHDEARTYT